MNLSRGIMKLTKNVTNFLMDSVALAVKAMTEAREESGSDMF